MLEALVLEKDIHIIIQSIGKYLRVPILYLNKDMEILSLWNTGPFSRSDLRNWFDSLIKNYYDLFTKVRMTNKYISQRHLNKLNQQDSVLILPLNNNVSFYGYLLIVNQKEAVPFQEIILKNTVTALILDAIKKNQTLEFQKNKDIRQFEEVFLNKRTEALKVQDFYYDIYRLHSIIIAEPEDMSHLKKSYQLIQKSIKEIDNNALVWIMDRRIIALLQVEFKNNIPEDIKIKIGISGRMKELTNEAIQILYEQAKISLHFSSIHKKHCCMWNDLGSDQIIYYMKESALLKDFHINYLHDLIDHDKKNQTELVKTLYVFLNTFFSLKESGAQLHLHPNTIKYRIKKIQEIMNINFDDSTQYINLMFSLKSYFYDFECIYLEKTESK